MAKTVRIARNSMDSVWNTQPNFQLVLLLALLVPQFKLIEVSEAS